MQYFWIQDNASATELAAYLHSLPAVAFDTETDCTEDGFQWRTEKQLFWQFSDGQYAWLIDLRVINVQIFKYVLESERTTFIIQDSTFDAAWTAREHKIFIRKIWDTRTNEQILLGVALSREGLKKEVKLLLEPRYSASLRFIMGRLGLPLKEFFRPMYYRWDWHPDQEQVNYMVHDVDSLHYIMYRQQEQLAARGLVNVSNLENEVSRVTYNMMYNGFGVDVEGWLRFTAEEEVRYLACMNILKAAADINWQSPKQYCAYFGVTVTAELKDKKVDDFVLSPYLLRIQSQEFPDYAVTDEEVAMGQYKFEILQVFRKARKHYKNVTTYGAEWISKYVFDGLVRCRFTQIVSTGRFSSSDPNLQNLPSTTAHRSFLIPYHGEGNVFVRADFSGQEMAIIAVGSGEQSWIACLRNGGDLHALVASTILVGWDSWDDHTRAVQRRIVKIINFSIAYGAGIRTIAERAGTTTEDISTRMQLMRAAYPRVFLWLGHNAREAKRTYTSFSFPPFYRYRSLALEEKGWRRENIGKNNPVQSTAADMSKLAMVLYQREIDAGLPALLIHMEHDELITECHASIADRNAVVLVHCMNEACRIILGEALSQPDVKTSHNWDKRKE